MNAVGRWLQLNPESLKKHTLSTWRLDRSGDLLGYTLAEPQGALLVAVVKETNSGVNLMPVADAPPRFTLEEVTSWSLPEALERISAGEITEEELNRLYLAQGGSSRTAWVAYVEEEDLELHERVSGWERGVFIATKSASGYIDPAKLLTGEKKILLTYGDIHREELALPDGEVLVQSTRLSPLPVSNRLEISLPKITPEALQKARGLTGDDHL